MKLLYITNIPAPYRQKRFNTMAVIFPKYGIDLEVLYMAKIEPNREWTIPQNSYRYNYKIFKGIHPRIGRFFAHFNPGLLLRLMKKDYDIAIVGGMASPTHWLAPLFIPKNRVQVMSIESNLYSVQQKHGFAAKMKRFLLGRANAYQITGNPQKEYIEFFDPSAKNKKFITLPNLIDEKIFRDQVNELKKNKKTLREKFGVNEEDQMWVLPARFIPIKGIIPFLALMEGLKGVKLFLLGDGPQKKEVKQIIRDLDLPVKITGFVQQKEIAEYYAATDLFVLPSLKDPSPLSPIEAIAAGLPILVSSRIGNLEDVLGKNENGWCYDPENEIEKGKSLGKNILGKSRLGLSEMGKCSLKRYNSVFDTEKCIERYAQDIRKLTNV